MNWVKVYHILHSSYGPQGWWPLLNRRKRTPVCYYHPKNYSHPRNMHERFEISVGAILTQNTTFTSVVECLYRLHRLGGLHPYGLLELAKNEIVSAITPARYPMRKTDYLITLAEFFLNLKNRIPKRKEILSLRGIGDETADSILLYAFNQAEFVIDTYTCRILRSLHSPGDYCYQEAKMVFENQLLPAFPRLSERVRVYQEYHALLVTHAKTFYSRKIGGGYGKDRSGNECFLLSLS